MDPDKSISKEGAASSRPTVLVGKSAAVRTTDRQPGYFTDAHRRWIGKTGRVHAVVPSIPKDNPLVKVGFDEGRHIVFFRLADLEIGPGDADEPQHRHGKRGSHLPQA
jgi:hypothetical protein